MVATGGHLVTRVLRGASVARHNPIAGLRAAGLLIVVVVRLRVGGLRSTARWLDRRPTAVSGPHRLLLGAAPVARARELAGVVRMAAVLVPDATCLRRALVLRYLLRREGIAAIVQIGARPGDDAPAFHAWVVVEGEVVSEPAQRVDGYMPLDVTDPRWPFAARRSDPR